MSGDIQHPLDLLPENIWNLTLCYLSLEELLVVSQLDHRFAEFLCRHGDAWQLGMYEVLKGEKDQGQDSDGSKLWRSKKQFLRAMPSTLTHGTFHDRDGEQVPPPIESPTLKSWRGHALFLLKAKNVLEHTIERLKLAYQVKTAWDEQQGYQDTPLDPIKKIPLDKILELEEKLGIYLPTDYMYFLTHLVHLCPLNVTDDGWNPLFTGHIYELRLYDDQCWEECISILNAQPDQSSPIGITNTERAQYWSQHLVNREFLFIGTDDLGYGRTLLESKEPNQPSFGNIYTYDASRNEVIHFPQWVDFSFTDLILRATAYVEEQVEARQEFWKSDLFWEVAYNPNPASNSVFSDFPC
ncbi:hypothetical protein K7432_004114 [Basidiobolus ranarum]|uniref:Knr4/Smi1-like domain-containing protein n=1 Tax=Basidiobolus ranarum TaxID=34480 RepID=A0ABR2WYS2_9FUNG